MKLPGVTNKCSAPVYKIFCSDVIELNLIIPRY